MDLNKLQLTPATIQNLYRGSVVKVQEFYTQEEESAPRKPVVMGKNNQNILFLTNNDQHPFCSDEEMELLTNLLGACKLTLDDIALVNGNGGIHSYKDLQDQLRMHTVVSFGIPCKELQLPFEIPQFQPYSFADCRWLFAPQLHHFLDNPALKRQLWAGLKNIFSL